MSKRLTVLVVVLMLVTGGGLLAFSICRVREAANRISCTNNLKQLGLALQAYHDSNNSFPPGTIPSPFPLEKRFSWLPLVVPYLEANGPLLYDLAKPWDAEENRDLKRRIERPKFPEPGVVPEVLTVPVGPIKTFFCPSNPNRLQEGFPSLIHYVGIAGLGVDAPTLPKEAPSTGVFGYDRVTALKDIKYPHNTLLLAETAQENGPWTAGGLPTVRGLDPSLPSIGRGAQFGCHPGGANMLFVDGSVRFLDEAMDLGLLDAMATLARRGSSR